MMLSIVVPVYNAERYLRQNIESIVAANVNELELILIDDGSTDGSWKICKEYAEKYSYITCFTQTNGGQGKARNAGLARTTGDWICFVDADDFLFTQGLIELIKKLKSLEGIGDVVVFDTYSYYESTETYEQFTGKYYNIEDNGKPGKEFYSNVLKNNISYGYCAWFYVVRKSLLIDNDLCFEESGTSNDVDFTFKIWNLCKQVFYFDIKVYAYRREQPSSITHNPSVKWLTNLVHRIDNNLNYLDSIYVDETFHDLLILSNFNLYLVILSILADKNTSDAMIVKNELISIKKRLKVQNKKIIKNFSKKICINYYLNRFLGINSLYFLWKIKKFFGKRR